MTPNFEGWTDFEIARWRRAKIINDFVFFRSLNTSEPQAALLIRADGRYLELLPEELLKPMEDILMSVGYCDHTITCTFRRVAPNIYLETQESGDWAKKMEYAGAKGLHRRKQEAKDASKA